MRFDKPITAQFESRGFPKKTTQLTGEIPEIMRAFAPWLREVTMGTKIVLTLVRSPEDLGKAGLDKEITQLFDATFGDEADEAEAS